MNTEGEFHFAVPPQFYCRQAASGYFHILCALTGAPGFPTSRRVGIAAPEGNSDRPPGRLAPAGGSLYRDTVFLLGLLHRTAIIVRRFSAVKGKTREKQSRTGCLHSSRSLFRERSFAALRMIPENKQTSPAGQAARAGVPVREYMRTPVLNDKRAEGEV